MPSNNHLPVSSERIQALKEKNVTLGFDGFIDAIVRVVRNKTKSETTFFQTIKEFGQYTTERSAGNFSLELHEVIRKPGGNMPIMALGLSPWVGQVNCIGALGYPEINPLFKVYPDHCQLLSFAEPGVTTALEFNDGKIIMGEMSSLNAANWETIKEIAGLDRIVDTFRKADLVGMVNWSELDHASDIWRGIQLDVLPRITYPLKPIAFFDLADCSKKTTEEIRVALDLINRFSDWYDVTLGLNRNEAKLIHNAITNQPKSTDDMKAIGDDIFGFLGIDALVIHFHTTALGWNREGTYFSEATRILNPLLSTGAGDNFNAGYCIGTLAGMNLAASLELGHTFASHYMQHGTSFRGQST